jgi:CHAT domain-containing protein
VSSGSVVAVLAGIGSSVLASLCAPAIALAQTTQREPITLSVDQRASATQKAGELVSYAFDAQAGNAYLIEVDQRGLDFTVTIDGGGSSRAYNSPLQRDEPEFVLVDAPQTGRYRITIGVEDLTDASGTHEVSVTLVEPSLDRRIVEAWRLMSDAAAASRAGERERAEQARTLYLAAAAFWEQLGQTRRLAQTLYSVGMLEYYQLENWNGAIEYADKAAQLYRGLDERLLYANSLLLHAYSEMETANSFEPATKESVFERVLTTYAEVLKAYDELGYDYGKAHTLNFTGLAHWGRADSALNDFDVARNYYNDSAELFSRLGEWREALKPLQNIVVIDQREGKSLQAIASFERILDRLPPGRDPRLRADILGNLGVANWAFGNVDEALRLHSSAYALYQSIHELSGQGFALKSLGETYFAFGDLNTAKRYFEEAQTFAESANDFRTQAAIQSGLGNVAFAERNYAEALQHHQHAVDLSASAEDRARRTLLSAKDLAAVGRHTEAIAASETAGSEARSDITRGDAFLRSALSHLALGDTSRAREALAEAAPIYERLQLAARQGDVQHAYSLAAKAEGDFQSAVAHGRAALDKIEALRERVAHPELRALNAAARRSYYQDQIDLLMELHAASKEQDSPYLREALSVDERSRARLTIDLLGEAAVDLNREMAPELVMRRRTLYAMLAEKRLQQERQNLPAVVERLADEIGEIENQLTLLETEYRRANPAYARIENERTLDAQEIQGRLDSDTLLLQYALGEQQSYVWAVTNESIRGLVLPSGDEIEALARAVHADLGKSPTLRPRGRLEANLGHLSDHVLLGVSDLLSTKSRLLVAADGALQYVPFGVLPIATRDDHARYTPLVSSVENREIVAVASMSATAAGERRPNTPAPRPSVAVFADPVMEETDSRFREHAATVSPQLADAAALPTRSGVSLSRLAYTGREAQAIANLLPNAENLIAVGFGANLDAVLQQDLRKYRYLHFATHGLVDSEHPPLSALALSQFDEQGRPRPGYLRLYDIYTLDLDADVVVLSACETGLGREIRGEGLIGLTQGFLYAGARNVVASLWQVPDRATSELMTRFYGLLLSDGMNPAQALAAAQRSMAAERSTSDPYFWGAFVVQGR